MQPIMCLSREGMLLKQPSGNRPNTAAKRRKLAFSSACLKVDPQVSQVVFIPRAPPHAQSLFLFPIVFGINFTDISSEHSLRTCTQIRRNVRKSDVVYACKIKKKNATEVTVSGIHELTLWSGAFITRGPPMSSPLFLPKESSHKFSVVFVNVMHF